MRSIFPTCHSPKSRSCSPQAYATSLRPAWMQSRDPANRQMGVEGTVLAHATTGQQMGLQRPFQAFQGPQIARQPGPDDLRTAPIRKASQPRLREPCAADVRGRRPSKRIGFRDARDFNRPEEIQGEVDLCGRSPANGARRDGLCQTRHCGLQAGENVRWRKDGDEQTFSFGFGHGFQHRRPMPYAPMHDTRACAREKSRNWNGRLIATGACRTAGRIGG